MINATTGTTDAASGAAAMKKSTGLNKDDFLNLFIAQMKNQDPLNPMDGTEFISQLAQLTQVEQAYNTNTNLQSLIDAQNNSNSLSAVSFLGSVVTAKGSQVGLTYGTQPNVAFSLASNANKVTIELRDAQGTLVRTLTKGETSQGTSSVIWDGKNSSGQLMPAGLYNVSVKATDASGKEISASPLVQGKVDGLKLDGKVPLLSIGGVDVPLGDVMAVKGA